MFDSWNNFVMAFCIIGFLLMGGCFAIQLVLEGIVIVANGIKWVVKRVKMWLYFRNKKSL